MLFRSSPTYAVSNKQKDVIAEKISDGYTNRWFLDPLLKGNYPKDMVQLYEKEVGALDFIVDGDLDIISTDMDFLGINYYTRTIVEYDEHSQLKFTGVEGEKEKTAMGWENSPESLYDLLSRIKGEYTRLPLYITENGAAYDDVVTEDNKVHDIERINFIKAHLEVMQKFIKDGGNLKGYYLWSLMDNFEWTYGYSKRFGIVYVDYNTQERIMKDSAIWYKNFIKDRSLEV